MVKDPLEEFLWASYDGTQLSFPPRCPESCLPLAKSAV